MNPFALGVCGFGRCGSSMVMRMLDAGGLPPAAGSSPRAYELPDLSPDSLTTLDLTGRAVKLLDYAQWHGIDTLPDIPWRFVFVERNHKQQATSMIKFLRGIGGIEDLAPNATSAFRRSFDNDKPGLLRDLRGRGEVHVMRYELVLADPFREAQRLADFVDIDAVAAASVVHIRSGDCAPDLTFEMSGVAS
ncbi:MAG: sulfotransferase domain-containing protein [Actinomycetota bacterium]|nr:sulfotransferase domain-containing protein [Actinomycetota bacterium]